MPFNARREAQLIKLTYSLDNTDRVILISTVILMNFVIIDRDRELYHTEYTE